MTADGPTDTALVELEQRFVSAMDDDLNSSGGLAVLFDLANRAGLANRLEREDAALPEPELKGLEGRWLLLRTWRQCWDCARKRKPLPASTTAPLCSHRGAQGSEIVKITRKPTGSGMSSPPKGWS